MAMNLGSLYVQIGADLQALKPAIPAIQGLEKAINRLADSADKLNATMKSAYNGVAKTVEDSATRQVIAEKKKNSDIEKAWAQHIGKNQSAADAWKQVEKDKVATTKQATKDIEKAFKDREKAEQAALRASSGRLSPSEREGLSRVSSQNKVEVQSTKAQGSAIPQKKVPTLRISDKELAGIASKEEEKRLKEHNARILSDYYRRAAEEKKITEDRVRSTVEAVRRITEAERNRTSASYSASAFSGKLPTTTEKIANVGGGVKENITALKDKILASQAAMVGFKSTVSVAFNTLSSVVKHARSEFVSFYQQQKTSVTILQGSFAALKGAISAIRSAAKTTSTVMSSAFSKMRGAVRSVFSSVFNLKNLLIGGAAAYGLKSIIDTSAAFEGMKATMKAVTNTSAEAASEFDFVRGQALRLGLDVMSLKKQYIDLMAATQGTAMQGDKLKGIFLSIAESGRVLQLSEDKMESAFYAIQQMFSKGKVQAEELRKQLGNVIPGSVPMMARAYAASVGKEFLSMEEKMALLEKAMKNGLVNTVKVMPFFAYEMQQTFGRGLQTALEKANAQFQNLKTSVLLLSDAIGRAGVLDFVADLSIELKNYILAVESIINQVGPKLKNLFPKFDKKGPEQYFEAAKGLIETFVNALESVVTVIYDVFFVIQALWRKLSNVFGDPIAEGLREQIKLLNEDLSKIPRTGAYGEFIGEGFEKQAREISDKRNELQKQLNEHEKEASKPLVYAPPDVSAFKAVKESLDEAVYTPPKPLQTAADLLQKPVYKWELTGPSKDLEKLNEGLKNNQVESQRAIDKLKAFNTGGVAAFNEVADSYDRLQDKTKAEELFAKLDKDKLQRDVIELYKQIYGEVPPLDMYLKPMSTEEIDAWVEHFKGKVGGGFQDVRVGGVTSGITEELVRMQKHVDAINNVSASDKFLGFFDPSITSEAVKFNLEVADTQEKLDTINKADPEKFKEIGQSIQAVANSGGIDLGKDFDPEKPKEVAKAMATVNKELNKSKDFGRALGDAFGTIAGQLSNLISSMTSMYEQQASYHAQLADQALSHGRDQAKMYMELADATYYSNTAQSQAYQEKAVASVQAAETEYQAQKNLQDKANEEARKSFELQKKLQIAQAIMSTANAVAGTLAHSADLTPLVAIPLAATMGALGAAQVAMISQQQFTPRAKGGSITGGKPYLVGEEGPELIVPGQGGTVVNNGDLTDSMGGGNISVVFNINATDASGFDRLLASRKGMIIGMIRQATNQDMRKAPV